MRKRERKRAREEERPFTDTRAILGSGLRDDEEEEEDNEDDDDDDLTSFDQP